MKTLYSFFVDCGRSGDLDGLFIADPADINRLIGKTVHFGEVLGKHSEVSVYIKDSMFEVKSDDQEFIVKLEQLLGTSISGFNPFDYIDQEDLDDDID